VQARSGDAGGLLRRVRVRSADRLHTEAGARQADGVVGVRASGDGLRSRVRGKVDTQAWSRARRSARLARRAVARRPRRQLRHHPRDAVRAVRMAGRDETRDHDRASTAASRALQDLVRGSDLQAAEDRRVIYTIRNRTAQNAKTPTSSSTIATGSIAVRSGPPSMPAIDL